MPERLETRRLLRHRAAATSRPYMAAQLPGGEVLVFDTRPSGGGPFFPDMDEDRAAAYALSMCRAWNDALGREDTTPHTDLVRRFHERHHFGIDRNLCEEGGDHDMFPAAMLTAMAMQVLAMSETLAAYARKSEPNGDWRMSRAHNMTEELAEVLLAMAAKDPVALLDGLGDLAYVTHGTAVVYGLPLERGFREIHRSNMTKDPAPEGEVTLHPVKGENYEPPDLAGCFEVTE